MKCGNCGELMISIYKREIPGKATVRTRECKSCKNRMHTMEISKQDYESAVGTLNLIIDLIRSKN